MKMREVALQGGVFKVLRAGNKPAVLQAWLELNRPDIVEMKLDARIVELLQGEQLPALGTDWHPWLERTVAKLMERF